MKKQKNNKKMKNTEHIISARVRRVKNALAYEFLEEENMFNRVITCFPLVNLETIKVILDRLPNHQTVYRIMK